MRSTALLLALLVAVACGGDKPPASSPPSGYGPDAILLRVPAEGGIARAYQVGSDSVLWESRDRAPASSALLGFDEFQGSIIGADAKGRVFNVDLRLGGLSTVSTEALEGEPISEGGSVFGFDEAGRVLRVTPVATWSWTPAGGADKLIPHPDGALILLSSAKGRTMVRRLIPPEPRVLDSTSVPAAALALRSTIGDRIWFVTDSGVMALRTSDLQRMLTVRMRDSITAIAVTPSGDRLYAATDGPKVAIINRFEGEETGRITLPQTATALRMDPDGHYLLARPKLGDSVYVISIGTERVVSAHASHWRADLPIVTTGGGVLLAFGNDAVLVDAESGRERMRYRGGADDRWLLVRWNGLRPRAAGLDRPVEFEGAAADSAAADSALAALMAARYGDISSASTTDIPRMNQPAAPRYESPPPERTGPQTWTVSFATLLAEDRAREMADKVEVDGRKARVIQGNRDGIPIWRVVLGPYSNREDAERAGMASRLPYWVFEGVP
ncbi:MAG TPA: SPOR domain-containing protein [Gemmatimonadaceae bacterium]|nr:SPOR domain-containing protein [Gemmatimonadaceae bacterium]